MSRAKFYNSDVIRKAYTAKKLLDLAYLIIGQAADVYVRKGMMFPVICSSTLLRLSRDGPASVTEIARDLQHPHQTIAQHLATLTKLGIAEKRPDETDRRRFEFHLTRVGEEQAALLEQYNLDAAEVFRTLDADIDVDLGAVLDAAFAALERTPMTERFSAPRSNRTMR